MPVSNAPWAGHLLSLVQLLVSIPYMVDIKEITSSLKFKVRELLALGCSFGGEGFHEINENAGDLINHYQGLILEDLLALTTAEVGEEDNKELETAEKEFTLKDKAKFLKAAYNLQQMVSDFDHIMSYHGD